MAEILTGKTIAHVPRGGLFRKYVSLFVAVVCAALATNGLLDGWFSFQQQKELLGRIQHEQAKTAALRIGLFVKELQSQLGWATQFPWRANLTDEWQFDAARLMRQVEAIMELKQLDAEGRQQFCSSRHALCENNDPPADFSRDRAFVEAMAHGTYFGPVHFERGSEPFMTVAMRGLRRDYGVIVAHVNLKHIWDVVIDIKVGVAGRAYVVDPDGRLIAHPDISLVLRNIDMSHLVQVQMALKERLPTSPESLVAESPQPLVTQDIEGRKVLSQHTRAVPVDWIVFAEQPVGEAYEPIYNSFLRSGAILLVALVLAGFAGLYLAQRMVIPIRALRDGAARIGEGDLAQRIVIDSGDELQELSHQFNSMARLLQDSYATLERKVEDRTRELAQSVEELRALGEVSQAVNSTLDLETVLETIVAKAVQLSGADAGTIYVFDQARGEFQLRATYGMSKELIASFQSHHTALSEALTQATKQGVPLHAADMRDESWLPQQASKLQQIVLDSGYRARMIVPLLGANRVVGALVVRRKAPGEFPNRTVDLLQTFAAQSVLAIQNARLFHEIEVKSHELALASQHKSQFLANMSHELRTPLNAVLGYTELMLDNIYGDTSQRMRGVLERVQSNGKHLLGLINDVLDLSKIEAGHLMLMLEDYSIKDIVQNVITAIEPLATEKSLALKVDLPKDLPTARGDQRRLSQVLFNLVGNAVKFTDSGEVAIKAAITNGAYTISVRDTGPGIDPADQRKIFEEFQQADGSSTKKKGGTGLGLSIARRIVAMHGGRIWVESALGRGSTFFMKVPFNVEQQVGSS